MSLQATNICLATVTTEAFVPGTLVMLYSFLKQNPWFKGDIVIIHGALGSNSQQDLALCFDRVRFLAISPRLTICLQKLITLRPDLASRQARFYSLEIFRLEAYDKVLFCDSDLLFRKSVDALFEAGHALICCGDKPYYRGNSRHAISFAEISESADEATSNAPSSVLRQTFNAGFLLLDALLLNEDHYTGILALLSEKTWQQIKTDHSDQVLYNLYFAGKQVLVGCEYNYLLSHRSAIYAREHVPLTEARVLHFNGPTKPWQLMRTLPAIQHDAALIQALRLWYEEYIECLEYMHLKGRISELQPAPIGSGKGDAMFR